MAERPTSRRVALAMAIVVIAAACAPGSDAAPAVERADNSCAERSIVLDSAGEEGVVSVTVIDTDTLGEGGDDDVSNNDGNDDIARQILETLELARVGDELGDRITPVGMGELTDSGFVLDVGPGCRTEVTFDPDVGADSATLRFVQLRIDSPACDVVRFRTVFVDTRWQLDSVVTPPAAALEEACGEAD